MTSPVNTSGKLQGDNLSGNQTVNAGFTFTAGRQAVLQISYFATLALSGVTIGGTAATLLKSAGTGDNAETWWVSSMAGGTANIVLTFPGGTTQVNYTGAVTEWASGTFGSADTPAANTNHQASTTAPTVSTATATVQADSVIFATFNWFGGTGTFTHTAPSGYTEICFEDVLASHEGGAAAWKEELTTGTKTATYTIGAAQTVESAIAILKVGGGGGSVVDEDAEWVQFVSNF